MLGLPIFRKQKMNRGIHELGFGTEPREFVRVAEPAGKLASHHWVGNGEWDREGYMKLGFMYVVDNDKSDHVGQNT